MLAAGDIQEPTVLRARERASPAWQRDDAVGLRCGEENRQEDVRDHIRTTSRPYSTQHLCSLLVTGEHTSPKTAQGATANRSSLSSCKRNT